MKRRFNEGGVAVAKHFDLGGLEEEEDPSGVPGPVVVASAAPAAPVKVATAADVSSKSQTEDLKKKLARAQRGGGNPLSNIESGWKRALVGGILGGGLGSSSGIGGILGGGILGGVLTGLLSGKDKRRPMDEKPTPSAPVLKTDEDKDTLEVAKGGPIRMPKSKRRLRFQDGGGVPPSAGTNPMLPGGPPPGLAGLPPGGPPPGMPPGGLPPGPSLGPGGPPPGLPPGGPPPGAGAGIGVGGPPPPGPDGPPMAPPPGGPPPDVSSLGALPPGMMPPPGGLPPGPPPGPAAPLPQVAAPGAAMGSGLPTAAPGPERPRRPVRPGMKKGGAVKGKGRGVLTRRPKISLAIAKKKSPVPTPAPYDIDAPEAPPPTPFAKGGKCDKMAAGGAAKARKGYPKITPKRMAHGGKVRGCGAATKGTTFSGIF